MNDRQLGPQDSFYVSTDGNDAWSGTRPAAAPDGTDGPFASLSRARDAVRELKSRGGGLDRPVTVMALEGTHRLGEPLHLDGRDSGSERCPVTYTSFPGHKAVLSAGRVLSDWEAHDGSILKCAVPEAAGGALRFRQLFFNGQRQVRARWPKRDADDPRFGGWAFVEQTLPEGEKNPDTLHYDAASKARQWSRLDQAEMNIFVWYCWLNFLLPVLEADTEAGTIRIDGSRLLYDMTLMKGNRFIIENVLEELTGPGEWYLDGDSGTVYFWPPEAGGEVVVPLTDRLIDLTGSPGDPVHHVHVRGFTFAHTLCPYPEHIHQECFHSPTLRGEAVRLEHAEDCVIERNYFDAVGGDGVRLHGETARNRILHNEIAHAGAAGVSIAGGGTYGPTTWTDREDLARRAAACPRSIDNEIAHNRIHHCGVLKKNCAGVQAFAVACSNLVIAHNEIYETSDKGVVLQDGFGRVIVEYNHMHDIAREGCDTGAVMTNRWFAIEGDERFGGGNVVRFNLIRNVIGCGAYGSPAEGKGRLVSHAGGRIWSPYYNWGIYFDNSGMNGTVYGNIVIGTVLGGVSLPVGHPKGNLYENNILVDCLLQQADLRVGDDQATGNRFVRNILYARDPESALMRIGVHTAGAFAECDFNLYCTDDGEDPPVNSDAEDIGSLADWRKAGFDAHSVVADPLFVDPEGGDYSLRPDSPAFELGFRPIDVSRIGPQG